MALGIVELRKLENTELKVTVKITREYKLRLWIFRHLICLAAWVLGSKCKIDIE